jgi:hypothetical protein
MYAIKHVNFILFLKIVLIIITVLGANYVRWGRTTCPSDNEVLYTGKIYLFLKWNFICVWMILLHIQKDII